MQTASEEDLDYGQNKAIQDEEAGNQATTESPEHTENERLRELDQLSRKQGKIISQLRRQLNDVNNQMSALRKDLEMRKREEDLQRQGEANTVTIRIAKPPMNIAHVGKPVASEFQNTDERLIEKKPSEIFIFGANFGSTRCVCSARSQHVYGQNSKRRRKLAVYEIPVPIAKCSCSKSRQCCRINKSEHYSIFRRILIVQILMDDISSQIRYLEADAAAVEPSVSGTNE